VNATNEIQLRPFEALKTNKVVSRKGAKAQSSQRKV